jgi:iron(III) transport system ATP-binding protein
MAVLDAGHIRQYGTPAEVYRLPHSRFVADFMGETNFIEGNVTGSDATGVQVYTALGAFTGRSAGNWNPDAGENCILSIRPEAWRLSTTPQATNAVQGRLQDRVYLGEMAQYQFNAGPQTLKIYELNPRFVDAAEDRELYAAADREDVVVLRP